MQQIKTVLHREPVGAVSNRAAAIWHILPDKPPRAPRPSADTPAEGYADWRDDNAFRAPQEKEDPWKQFYPQETKAAPSNGEADEQYPPRDWHKTEDPELRAEYLHAQLLKQFGDLPEVRTIADFELNVARGIAQTVDEHINFIEAHNSLFPHESHRRTLENLRKAKADGRR